MKLKPTHVLFIIIFEIHITIGLKCYSCELCDRTSNGKLVDCGENYDQSCKRRFVKTDTKEFVLSCEKKTPDHCDEAEDGYTHWDCYCNTDGCNGLRSLIPQIVTTPASQGSVNPATSNSSAPTLTSRERFISLIAVVTIPLYMY